MNSTGQFLALFLLTIYLFWGYAFMYNDVDGVVSSISLYEKAHL